MKFQISNCQAKFGDLWLRWVWGEIPLRLMTGSYWREVRIGSGNGLPHQDITKANVDQDLCRHMSSLGHNELTNLDFNIDFYQIINGLAKLDSLRWAMLC